MKITTQQLFTIIRGMTMAELYLQDHVGDSDQKQYEIDAEDVAAALRVIDQLIEENDNV
jgi:hypothetical protein